MGDFCEADEYSTEGCASSWMSKLSLPNKLNNEEALELQENLNLVACGLIIILLILFRRSQRKINAEIDEKQNSPADYTIMVKNIPSNRNCDYVKDLKEFFSNQIDPVKKYNVTKVNLLWEIDEMEEYEEKIKELIGKKKRTLISTNFDYTNPTILKINEELERCEGLIEKKMKKIETAPDYFAGMAFVSFQTEDGT